MNLYLKQKKVTLCLKQIKCLSVVDKILCLYFNFDSEVYYSFSQFYGSPKGQEKSCVAAPLRVLLKVFINMSFSLGVNLGLGPIWGWDQFGSGANLELEPIRDGANLGWGKFGADPIWDRANLDWDQFGSGPIWSGPIWVGPKCPGPIWGVIKGTSFFPYLA